MPTYHIYVLRCPDTHEIRYVGCTRFPNLRQREHCRHNIKEKKTPLQVWLCELREQEKEPIFEVVDSFVANGLNLMARGVEARWIRDVREQGHSLLNVHWNRYRF